MATSFPKMVVVCVCLLLYATPAAAGSKWWLSWLDELSGPGPFKGQTYVAELWCIAGRNDNEKRIIADEAARLGKAREEIGKLIAPATASTSVTNQPVQVSVSLDSLLLTQQQLQGAQGQLKHEQRRRVCYASRDNAFMSIVFEMGRWNDEQGDRYPGDTSLKLYQAISYFPLHRVLGPGVPATRSTRALEAGVGIGAYRLKGSTIRGPELWRGSIPFRIRFIPSELFYADRPEYRALPTTHRKQPLRVMLQSLQFRFGGDILPGRLTSESFEGLEVNTKTEWLWTTSIQIDIGAIIASTFRTEPRE